jgi:hypothetical protein
MLAVGAVGAERKKHLISGGFVFLAKLKMNLPPVYAVIAADHS